MSPDDIVVIRAGDLNSLRTKDFDFRSKRLQNYLQIEAKPRIATGSLDSDDLRLSIAALRAVRDEAATDIVAENAADATQALVEVEKTQVDLYKAMVLERVSHRFSTEAAAQDWFENGRIPGYGDKTPMQIVAQGHVARVIAAVNAIEAGVHA